MKGGSVGVTRVSIILIRSTVWKKYYRLQKYIKLLSETKKAPLISLILVTL